MKFWSMSLPTVGLVLLFIFCTCSAQKESGLFAGILVTLTEDGLSFVRQVLVDGVLQDLTPLRLPDVHKTLESPVGTVEVALNNITIQRASVNESLTDIDSMGIGISASGIQVEITLQWSYSYSAFYVPIPIGDSGSANIKVDGGEAEVIATLKEHNGTLDLTVMKCDTYLDSLDIELHGGASWLYQWFVYAFEGQIKSTVESALTTQLLAGVANLDNVLLHLPRQLPVDNTSVVDVTVVDNPVLSSTYLSVGIKGEFLDVKSPNDIRPLKKLPAGILCSRSNAKMAAIALNDYTITSASEVYFEAGRLEWMVDKLPEQSLLNTASWKYLIPKLYRLYPNRDMLLNISAASPPEIWLTKSGIEATSVADMTIDVVDSNQTVSVACISLTISINAVAGISANNVTAQASLKDLNLELKWSEIGTFPVKLVQVATKTVVKDVILPLLNRRLQQGFPLPVIPAVELEDSTVQYEDEFLLVCTNVRYTGIPRVHSSTPLQHF